ncbi:PRP1 splicing factor, N-terminal-domain-containing protein [Roridomyces roridus]|uniref:PRP1 splicing factor, N-terminal-domain-containing protein n=1 Tax=Roridomyces roridus TaxID=1738132 RepID=A0AAD7C480_9AGAR|nr:PRP1 splicing factor, N-terminal-domain-containing protein [Roridomyces roridus]
MASSKPNKLAFLSMPAPASYVAGLGRGASGFTTRSDIGPARDGPSAEPKHVAGEEAEVDPDQFQDPDNEYGLFAGTTYEQDDEEADKIYQQVDDAMDSRRRARREVQEQLELAKHRAERPKIQQQFADLKRGLSAVTDEEWESIPEVGNLTRKKRRKQERSFAVPDSVLVGDRSKAEYENSLDDRQQQSGGFETPAESGALTNFVEIGQARDKILSLKLDQISGTATSGTSTSVDPKGYLTSLNSVVLKSDAEIGDIKRARMLFDSLVKSNPKHSPGWIAAACLEEHAGRMVAARKIIKAGCEQCPKSEDVWLEAARLHNNDDAKVILANAVQHVGQSVKVWLAAADLEHDVKAKKRVLRKALEHIPNSVRLWKETVNLESSAADARVLLARAVEVIPLSVELWLALARLETPERAKGVLNKARKAVRTSHEIWIAAGRLLEQQAQDKTGAERDAELDAVDKTIVGGVRELRKYQVLLTREQWLKEAERCETEGSPRTCEAIVKATVGMEIEEEDRLDTGMVGTARAILAEALRVFPGRKSLWIRAAELEKTHGTRESLDAILNRAVEHCPQAEVLWLMAAKEKWLAGDVPAAREVLERAFGANKESEQIWLAAVKLEAENNELGVARELLVRARMVADTERIWMKSAVFERQQGQLRCGPRDSQILQSQGNFSAARAAFAAGLKACPKEATLWILASRLEEADGKSIKARAILEKARLVNPANDVLWAEAVGVEERSGGAAQGKAMLARSLQECPTSGLLWSMSIWAESRPMRKARSVDALKKSADNPVIICTVARLFWAERKIEKARQWFGRAVATDPDLGDSWAWWLKFERQHGTEEHRDEVRKKCVAADPHHSLVWQSVAKDIRNTGKSTAEILELVADTAHPVIFHHPL